MIVEPTTDITQGGLSIEEIADGPNAGHFELLLDEDNMGLFPTFEAAAKYRASVLEGWSK